MHCEENGVTLWTSKNPLAEERTSIRKHITDTKFYKMQQHCKLLRDTLYKRHFSMLGVVQGGVFLFDLVDPQMIRHKQHELEQ